jgi:large subunit ribosomal protein L36e
LIRILSILIAKAYPAVVAIGKNKGHPVTKYDSKTKTVRPAQRKGALGKRVKLIRQVIGEVGGVSSYEKRVIEFLKAGSLKDTKRALKVSKKGLGTHRRAKLKRESQMNLLRAQQSKAEK